MNRSLHGRRIRASISAVVNLDSICQSVRLEQLRRGCMVVPGSVRSEALYITAKEAAAALGVSIPTLYAYVSRGLIRSQGVAGSRNRRYWKVDIDRLRGRRVLHEPSQGQASPGEETKGLVAETKITLLTERGLYYRGRDVAELAETDTFESVAALLWDADAKAVFGKSLPSAPPSLARLRR